MVPPKPKLSLSEIVMIELMKLDDGFADYHESVDMSVPLEVRDSYALSPEKFRPRLLAERAKLYCQKKMGIAVDEVQSKWMRWSVSGAAFTLASFVFFALLTAIGVPAMFFSGEKREASVLAVSVLIGVMALPCLIPLISLVSLVVQRLSGRPQATLANLILWLIEAVRDAWASVRGRSLPSAQSAPIRFAELFKRNSYFTSSTTIFLTNLYFVLMGIAIWGVLWLFLFSRNVNYVHESSLSTAEERASFIVTAGRPVEFVTGTPTPGPEAMHWAGGTFAFDEKTFVDKKDDREQEWTTTEIETHKNHTIAVFRRDWSQFLLSSVWTWVFLPRLVVAIGAVICMAWFRRDLLPKHNDPAANRIVAHVQRRGSRVDKVVEQKTDDDESAPVIFADPGPLPKPNPEPVPPGIPTEPPPKKPHDPEPPRPVPRTPASVPEPSTIVTPQLKERGPEGLSVRPGQKAIVGLGLTGAAAESTTRLSGMGKQVRNLGNLNGAKLQLQFRSDWKLDDFANTDLVVLVSLISVPTVSQGDFLADLVATAMARSPIDNGSPNIRVVLTDGRAARDRGNNDPDFFETRVSQWMGRIVEADIPKEHIYEFDVSNASGVKLAWKALFAGEASDLSKPIQLAGKVTAATKIIRDQLAYSLEQLSNEEKIDWSQQVIAITDRLSSLYFEERKSLTQYLEAQEVSGSVLAAIKTAQLPDGMVPEELQAISKAMELFKTVSPQWIGAGALGGFGLGLVAGFAVIATGGAALLPVALSILPYSIFGGAAVSQLTKTFGFSNTLAIDQTGETVGTSQLFPGAVTETLRASILQVIIFELQGNDETFITNQLRRQTERLDHHSPQNLPDIEAMLAAFERGMSETREAR